MPQVHVWFYEIWLTPMASHFEQDVETALDRLNYGHDLAQLQWVAVLMAPRLIPRAINDLTTPHPRESERYLPAAVPRREPTEAGHGCPPPQVQWWVRQRSRQKPPKQAGAPTSSSKSQDGGAVPIPSSTWHCWKRIALPNPRHGCLGDAFIVHCHHLRPLPLSHTHTGGLNVLAGPPSCYSVLG